VTGDASAGRAAAENADEEMRPKRAASEIAALVSTRVRDAIEGAERSAQAVKTQALDDASARRGAVHDRATEVLARIDELERRLTHILQELRGDAARIAKTVEAPSNGAEDRDRSADLGQTASPGEAGSEDVRAGDQPPPAAAPAMEARLAAAEDAPDEHAETAPGEFAGPRAQEGEPVTPAAADAEEREESGAEHPHGEARRRRPRLFRHRRDG
jgi:hypothetical protein